MIYAANNTRHECDRVTLLWKHFALKRSLIEPFFSAIVELRSATLRRYIHYWSLQKFFQNWQCSRPAVPETIYLYKVNIANTRKRYKTCSKVVSNRPDSCQWHRSVAFDFNNFTPISAILLLTLNKYMFIEVILHKRSYWNEQIVAIVWTDFKPLVFSYTPWKRQKTGNFSWCFKGYKKRPVIWNGLVVTLNI